MLRPKEAGGEGPEEVGVAVAGAVADDFRDVVVADAVDVEGKLVAVLAYAAHVVGEPAV
jgi:hypothetical protein